MVCATLKCTLEVHHTDSEASKWIGSDENKQIKIQYATLCERVDPEAIRESWLLRATRTIGGLCFGNEDSQTLLEPKVVKSKMADLGPR